MQRYRVCLVLGYIKKKFCFVALTCKKTHTCNVGVLVAVSAINNTSFKAEELGDEALKEVLLIA